MFSEEPRQSLRPVKLTALYIRLPWQSSIGTQPKHPILKWTFDYHLDETQDITGIDQDWLELDSKFDSIHSPLHTISHHPPRNHSLLIHQLYTSFSILDPSYPRRQWSSTHANSMNIQTSRRYFFSIRHNSLTMPTVAIKRVICASYSLAYFDVCFLFSILVFSPSFLPPSTRFPLSVPIPPFLLVCLYSFFFFFWLI